MTQEQLLSGVHMDLLFVTAQQNPNGLNIFLIVLPAVFIVLMVARLIWVFIQRNKK